MPNQLGISLWHQASDLEDAGDLEAAIKVYLEAIDANSVDAMINLGNIFDDKIEPPQPEKAVMLYERAVRMGSSIAAWNLAKHYDNLVDRKNAIKWMKVAANMGDEDARNWLMKRL